MKENQQSNVFRSRGLVCDAGHRFGECFDPTVLDQGESNYGSSLVSQSAGSYVIVALIAFCLGVLLAVSVLFKSGRLTKRKHAKDEDRQF